MTQPTPLDWRDLFSIDRLTAESAQSHPLAGEVPLALWLSERFAQGGRSVWQWARDCPIWSIVEQQRAADGKAPMSGPYLDRLASRANEHGASLSSPGPAGVWVVTVVPIASDQQHDESLGAVAFLRPARQQPDDLADTVFANTGVRISEEQTAAARVHLDTASKAVHAVSTAVDAWTKRVGRLWNAELTLREFSSVTSSRRVPKHAFLDPAQLSALDHEVRAPLATLRGVATTLRSEPDMARDELGDFLGMLEREALRVGVIVDEALAMVRLSLGERGLDTQVVQLPLEISAQVALIGQNNDAMEVAIRQTGSRDAWVRANPAFLGRLIRNLVTNVLGFVGAEGAINVGCGSSSRDMVRLEVIGKGVSIDIDEVVAALSHFERKRLTTRIVNGSGLGLSVSHRIAEAHGWTMDVLRDGTDGICIAVSMPAVDEPSLV